MRSAGVSRGTCPRLVRHRLVAMMQIRAVRGCLPEHRYSQAEITEAFGRVVLGEGADQGVLRRFHGNAGVSSRHLALPIERYVELADFGEANDAFIEVGVDLGARAVTDALKASGPHPAGRRPLHLDHGDRSRRTVPGRPDRRPARACGRT